MKFKTLAIASLIPSLLSAGGFQVNLQGNKQTGMGHLGTSFYLGAASAYFNPAMMGMDSNKFSFSLGSSFIMSDVTYQSQETGISEETDNDVSTPFYFYGTYKVNDKVAVGLAAYTPYGSSVNWGKDWTGKNLIQEITLRAIYFQPTVSYTINDKLSVGAGLTAVFGSFEIDRALPAPIGNDNSVHLEGDETGMGFNVGIHYQLTEKLSVGATYRSKVDIELEDGEATFDVDPSLAAGFPDGQFAADLPLVATSTIGIAYQVSDKLLVSVEGSFVEWGDYESLDFDFENNTSTLDDSENPRNYEDAIIIRVGGQYTLNSQLQLRLGAYYDESPIQDEYFNPETPNSTNLALTGGLSYMPIANLSIDVSTILISGEERTSEYSPENFGGKYKSSSIIPGIGLSYNF